MRVGLCEPGPGPPLGSQTARPIRQARATPAIADSFTPLRTPLDGAVIEEEPKSARSKRTLPLDDDLVAAFTALRLRQQEEAEHAGEAYGRCMDCAELHVVVDDLGDPVHPELPRIRLHDCRHTCGTLMHLRGVPTAVISAWLGHASASFTMKTYVHSQDEALRAAGASLTGAFKPAPVADEVAA